MSATIFMVAGSLPAGQVTLSLFSSSAASHAGWVTLVGAIWFAGLRLGRGVPVLTLALLAANPEILRWSATVRPWGLGSALAIVVIVSIFDVVESPTPRRVALAAVAAAASVLCLLQNAIFLAAAICGATVVAVRSGVWRRALGPLGIGVLAALAVLPVLGPMTRRADWNGLGVMNVPLAVLWRELEDVVLSSGTFTSLLWAAIVIAALLAAGRAVFRRSLPRPSLEMSRRTNVAIYGSVVILTSAIALFGFYLRLGYSTQAWYYIGLLALVAVLAESITMAVPLHSTCRYAATAGACLTLAAGIPSTWTELAEGRLTNVDAIAARLLTDAMRDDLIIANPWYLGVTLNRYYRGSASAQSIPPLDDLTLHRYDLLKRQMQESDRAMEPLLARMAGTLSSGHRVWIVGYIAALPIGQPVRRLPPPPLARTGWYAEPYEQTWMLQAGEFLRDHAANHSLVDVGVEGGRLESPRLVKFEGWRGR